MFYTTATCSK